MVKLAEDERHEDVAGGDGALGVGSLDDFEAGEGALVVEVVEVLVGLADLGGEIDGVGVAVRFCNLRGVEEGVELLTIDPLTDDTLTSGGMVGLRVCWRGQQEREKKKAEGFDAGFYRCSPGRRSLSLAGHLQCDAGHRHFVTQTVGLGL
jgi:hypothetical protein